MLVLSRKADQKIRIGDDVVLTIVEIRGDKVRLGFDAPDDVFIDREEVAEKIKASGGKRLKRTKGSPKTGLFERTSG